MQEEFLDLEASYFKNCVTLLKGNKVFRVGQIFSENSGPGNQYFL